MTQQMTPWAPDPTKKFQISQQDGMFVLWEPEGRQGVSCRVQCAENTDCMEEEVYITAHHVDDQLVELDDRGVGLCVDWSRGAVTFLPDASPTPQDETLRALVQGRLHEEILEWLYTNWLAARGFQQDPTPVTDLGAWEPGLLLFWRQAFPDSRLDRYELDSKVYAADDGHCVVPACDCRDVRVRFAEETSEGRLREVATVTLAMPGGTPTEWDTYRMEEAPLRRLFALYKARHGDLHTVAARTRRLRSLGHDLYEKLAPRPVVSGPKIGRNDPCPCGSGKKYKRCCLISAPRPGSASNAQPPAADPETRCP